MPWMNSLDWVSINKSLQGKGWATNDVACLLENADELLRDGHHKAAYLVTWAARDVLRHQRMARQRMARLISRGIPAKMDHDINRLRPTYAERIFSNHMRRKK